MENSPNGGQKVSMDIKAEASEFEGNTVDEAISKAVVKFGVPKNHAIEPITYESLGTLENHH